MAEQSSLEALARGDLGEWSGLPGSTSRAEVEAALGPGELPQAATGILFGSALTFNVYARSEAAPHGVTVWYQGENAVLVELQQPRLPASVEELLGPPEAKEPSLLGSARSQWIYASRGLTLHVTHMSGAVFWVYGYEPCSVEEFLAGPLSSVSMERIPSRG